MILKGDSNMTPKNKEYQESREFNPVIRAVNKYLFGLKRYKINILLLIIAAGSVYLSVGSNSTQSILLKSVAALLGLTALSLRIALEWERVPVLRLGRYIKTRGPGPFFIIPFVDTPCGYIDCRVTVTDFSVEKVLTKDAVPIFIDAIMFWMIWDAAKASLEVENYKAAVPLSAKTALRDIIGKTTLAKLLTDRNEIGQELQNILDAKTNPWGITSLSVEIKAIVVPSELEDSISREAQAEREKNARIILGSAEIELAEQYSQASQKYKGNNEAMTLRSLNLLLDTVKSKGSVILVPSEVPHLMNKALAAALPKQATLMDDIDGDV